jgi:GDP-L-fucose synthase
MLQFAERIYVAGHTGMVGSAIVRQLVRVGQPKSHIITRRHSELDLTNQAAVRAFFEQEKPDQVYLAAAQVGGESAQETQPVDFFYSNLMIQANVIEAAFRAGVKKLLLVASQHSYPTTALQPMYEEDLFSGPLSSPHAPSSAADLAGIQLCESYNRQYGHSHGVDFRSVITCNVYGPGANYRPGFGRTIPTLIRRVHEAARNCAESVWLSHNSQARLESIFVDDMSEACVYVMEMAKTTFREAGRGAGSHINVGSGYDVSLLELAQTVAQAAGYRGDILFDSHNPETAPPNRLLEVCRLSNLGWEPMMDLHNGLEISYMDYKLHHAARQPAALV